MIPEIRNAPKFIVPSILTPLLSSIHPIVYREERTCLTPWLNFFIAGLAEVFQEAAKIVKEKSAEFTKVEPKLLRGLDVYQRPVFAQLAFKHNYLTTSNLQKLTGFADRTVRDKVKKWIEEGFIVPLDPKAQRIRAIKLAPPFQELADEVSKDPDSFKYLLLYWLI